MAHGKVSRKKNRDKQLAKKKARREANQAKYQALAAEGKNKKSKRHTLGNRRKKQIIGKHEHRDGYCGNLACRQCFTKNSLGVVRPVKGPAFELPKRLKVLLEATKGVITLRSGHTRRKKRGVGRRIMRGHQGPFGNVVFIGT